MITNFKLYEYNYYKDEIKKSILDVEDFPKKGITFKDITPILSNPNYFRIVVDDIYNNIKNDDIDIVLGMDARGFIMGPAIANKLGVGFAMARKPGKLPPPYEEIEYDLEYGSNKLSVSTLSIKPGMRVHIHDDLLATGGTAEAACKLIEKIGAEVASISFILELPDLNGREKLNKYKVYSFM